LPLLRSPSLHISGSASFNAGHFSVLGAHQSEKKIEQETRR
jgi:hypothetical protein